MVRKQQAEQWAEYRRQRDEEEGRQRVMAITEFDAGGSRRYDARDGRRDPPLPALCETARERDRVDEHRGAVWSDSSWPPLASEARARNARRPAAGGVGSGIAITRLG